MGEPQGLTQDQGGSDPAPTAQGLVAGQPMPNASEARKEKTEAESSLLWHMRAAGPATHCQTSLSSPDSLHRCVQEPPQLVPALGTSCFPCSGCFPPPCPGLRELNLGCGAAAEELSCLESLARPPNLWHFPATFLC